MAARRSWRGAKPGQAWTSSLACQPIPLCVVILSLHALKTPVRFSARQKACLCCAAFARPCTLPRVGENKRRVIGRFEARRAHGMNIGYIVTSLSDGTPEHLYERVHCARGQMENPIKLHKAQLKSDRTSCSSATTDQMRLILHTIAYWMIRGVRAAMPKAAGLKRSDFETSQRCLPKIGARIMETRSRIRVAFASACPDKILFIAILDTLPGRQNSCAQAP